MKILSYADLRSERGIKFSKVHLWRLERAGKFPKRVSLGKARHGWLETEINEWILARLAERDGSGAA